MKDIFLFKPNSETHSEFAEALKRAKKSDVKILAYDCIITKESIEIDKEVKTEI